MKRVFIIHGWGKHPEEGWYPWLKKELEKNGFEVFVPAMPNTDEPKINEWVDFLSNLVGEPDENTYFVGHSIGCQAILRYLEKVMNKKVGGAIFVSGWFNLSEYSFKEDPLNEEESRNIAKPWLETPINFEEVKKTTNNFVAIFSDSDPYVPIEDKNIFKEKLGAEIIIEHNKGHFDSSDGVIELPSALNSLFKMSTRKT